ncbi:biliverdin-producing heme oxygenase [uncultured Arcticibacterium sp.]|uniref:biliverdin-producing heme oxygenase n=1 Tax=uncultured Arcticibacterium sp. TaxID=2173042 RepID=UPI0030FA0026
MIAEQLKKDTLEEHQNLEGMIVRRLKQLENKADLAKVLKSFYGFYNPLETAIEKFIFKSSLPDMETRRKSSWLLQDLQNLEVNNEELPLCDDITTISNKSQALGAMYVLEGSTLGGEHINKMLQKQLNLNDEAVLTFFSSYKENTYKKWAIFLKFLENQTNSKEEQQLAIQSANETFTKFHKWLTKD